MKQILTKLFKKFLASSLVVKLLILSTITIGGWLLYSNLSTTKASEVSYQTTQVTKGDLITTVTASGNITSGNNLTISTSATGTVKKMYVSNGDVVKKGQKIAEITLDQDSLQKHASAWASYLSAKNNLQTATDKLNSLQAAEFSANQKFINGAVARDLDVSDPTYIQENATWLQAEADYKNQFNAISQAKANLTSAWYSYQQVSPTITAPADGVVSNLIIAEGSVISSSGSSTSNSTTTQQLGAIKNSKENTQAEVSLTEMDATKVNPGQKVTITMDAFPEKTFTGKVLTINTNGSVSSGVTTYPVTILFDTSTGNIYPNMGVNATIITNIEQDVLLIPNSAVQNLNGEITTRIMKDGKVQNVQIEIGSSNGTHTSVLSGVNEGDSVVTSVSQAKSATKTTNGTTSVFGTMRMGPGR